MTRPTPTDHVRIGAISAAIWANSTDSGTRYGVTIERLYRDPDTGHWKSSSSFNRDDLLLLAKVADRVHTRIHELQDRDRGNGSGGDRSPDRDTPQPETPEPQPQPPAPAAGGAPAREPSGQQPVNHGAARAKARSGAAR